MIKDQKDSPNIASIQQSYAKPGYAWYLVVLVTVAYSLAVIDRVSLGLLVEPIQTDLNLSDTQFGILHGLAFVLFSALAGFPIGMAVDRWSRKKVLFLGTLVLGLATLGSAFAGTFMLLFLARVLVGAGDASVSPASSALIADYFPPEKRGRAYGVYASGIAIGSGAAFGASAGLLSLSEYLQANEIWFFADLRVWQVCFFLLGIPGVLLSLIILFTVKERAKIEPGLENNEDSTSDTQIEKAKIEKATLGDFFDYLLGKRALYASIIVGVAIIYIAGNSFFSWYVAFLMRTFEFSPQQAGSAIGAITVPLGLASALSSGWVISWFYSKNRKDAPLITICIMAATSCSFLFLSAISPTATLSLVFFAISALTVNWGFPAALTALNNITPPQFRGQITALFTMSLGIIAIGFGPVITGVLTDSLYGGPENIGKSLATVSVVCGIVGFILVYRCRSAYTQNHVE